MLLEEDEGDVEIDVLIMVLLIKLLFNNKRLPLPLHLSKLSLVFLPPPYLPSSTKDTHAGEVCTVLHHLCLAQ